MRLTRTLPAGNTFADPHSEFLQMAIDMGVVGLIGYWGLILSSLMKGLRTWQKHPYQIVIVLTLILGVSKQAIFYLIRQAALENTALF